jgi:hypothetical protein
MSVYPLVTWRVPVPAFTITMTYAFSSGSPIVVVVNVPAGNYWGWRTVQTPAPTTPFATTDSLAGVLRDAIGSSTETYYVSTPQIGWQIDTIGALSLTITATSDPAALALFGVSVGTVMTEELVITRRTAGVWRPAPVADPVTIEPRVRLVGQGAWSPYNPAENDRVRVGATRLWETLWEYCAAADVSREFARQNNYLSVAGRAAGDTAGTFEDLLDAASRRYEMALALQRVDAPTQPIHYVPVILPVTGDLDAGAYITDAGAGQRLYAVSMAMLEAGNAVL